MRAATTAAARALLSRSITRQSTQAAFPAPTWTTATSHTGGVPWSLKGKERQHISSYTQTAAPPRIGTSHPEEAESSKAAQARSAEEEALLEQCRYSHEDPDSAVQAYLDLRNRPGRLLRHLTDPKFERLCEAIATSQRADVADTLLEDLLKARFGAKFGTTRRLTALQLLITRGFSSDGKRHILAPVRLDRAFRLACEDWIALRSTNSTASGQVQEGATAQQEIANIIDVKVADAYLLESLTRDGMLPKVLTIALVRRVQSLKMNTTNALGSEKVLASLANQLYFHPFLYPQKRDWSILVPADLLALFRRAAISAPGIVNPDTLRKAQSLGESWRAVDESTGEADYIPSLITLAALSVKVGISTGGKTIPPTRIIESLHKILTQASSKSRPTGKAHAKAVDICIQLLNQQFDALTNSGPRLEHRIQLLIWTFARFERTLLPYVTAQRILGLTGRITAGQLAASTRADSTSKSAKYSNAGRDKVATLLETALRSRLAAKLTGAASHDALISAIFKSPLFPIIFARLSQARRGDLVGSLLELMHLVPRKPNFDRPTGALGALSAPFIVSWQGRLDDVIASDRPLIIQAAAQAKLRWHAAFLYHRWAELQLLRDNGEIFKRFGRVIGELPDDAQHLDVDRTFSQVGFSLMVAERAAREGVPLRSNAVVDSATCTWNMVKLFASSAGGPAQSRPLDSVIRSRTTTDWDFAKLIERTSVELAQPEHQTAKDITTRAATAFALKDTDTAIQLLTQKLDESQSLDEVDVGVMMAGIADSDVEAAVNAFLSKLQSSGETSATEGASNMDTLMQQVRPTPELFLMLISQSMFRDRSDLVARLLEEADKRDMLESAILQSMEVILRQNFDLRPKDLLELITKLISENEWNPDPRLLAWFCRCAARGQTLKEAMDSATHANADASETSDTPRVMPRKRVVGNVDDLIAAVGMLELSVFRYDYVHYYTALLLIKLIPHLEANTDAMVILLKRVVQLLFSAKRIDKGAQQRLTSTDLQVASKKYDTARLPVYCSQEIIRSYVSLGDFRSAAETIRRMESWGFDSTRLADHTFQPTEKPSAMFQGINVEEEVLKLKAEMKRYPRLAVPKPTDRWREEIQSRGSAGL